MVIGSGYGLHKKRALPGVLTERPAVDPKLTGQAHCRQSTGIEIRVDLAGIIGRVVIPTQVLIHVFVIPTDVGIHVIVIRTQARIHVIVIPTQVGIQMVVIPTQIRIDASCGRPYSCIGPR